MNFFTKEVKIGITAIIAILIVYFGIIFLKGIKLSHTNNVYYVRMHNVNGLLVAGDVVCNGLKVGSVKNMNYKASEQEIIVAVELDEGFHITRGSSANIQKDMLGAPKLNLNLGNNPSSLIAVGDTINGIRTGGDILSAAGEMMPDIKAVIPKIDSLITALNNIARDPALSASLHNIQGLTAELKVTSSQLNGMTSVLNRNMPSLMTNANNTVSNLASVSADLNNADIAGLTSTATQTINNANQAMIKANTAIDNVSSLASNANILTTNLNTLTQDINYKLNNQNSTLGKLMNDDAAYNHLDSTLRNASNLMIDLRQNPKRYVHFSLFGKKDKSSPK